MAGAIMTPPDRKGQELSDASPNSAKSYRIARPSNSPFPVVIFVGLFELTLHIEESYKLVAPNEDQLCRLYGL
jgi:hypothetical protein